MEPDLPDQGEGVDVEAIQQRTTEIGGGRGQWSAARVSLLLAVVAVALTMTAVVWVSRPASGTRAGAAADPQLAPASVAFRATERASLGH